MGKEVKNIDEFIRQGLSGFEAPPPADAWDAIAQQVQKPQRKLMPVFWRWAAAVAIIIGLSFILKTQYLEHGSGSLSKTEIINQDQQNTIEEKELQKSILENEINPINPGIPVIDNESELKEVRASDDQKSKPGNAHQSDILPATTKILAQSSEKIENTIKAEKSQIAQDENLIANIPEVPIKITEGKVLDKDKSAAEAAKVMQDQKSIVIVDKPSNPDVSDEINKSNQKTNIPDLPQDLYAENKKEANWSVGGSLSPVYSFRNLNKTKEANSYAWPGGESNEQNEHPIIAFSGGVDVEYNARRWSVSTGVYYSQSGRETDNFSFNRIIIFNSQTNIYASTSAGNVAYEQVSNIIIEGLEIDGQDTYIPNALSEPIESDATLRQDFEYLEVPLIAKYKLIDRKIDVQFLAGLSTSFLMGNSNVLQYSSKELDMGKIDNLRSVNYNSLVGLGFQYPFTRSLRFRFQPMFKYALKPINEDYSINSFPYSFAIYTGIAFDF